MSAPLDSVRLDYSSLSKFVDSLQAEGRYSFLRDEALAKMQVSAEAFKKAVARLVAKRRVAMPKRGFYVIVPIEYRLSRRSPQYPRG